MTTATDLTPMLGPLHPAAQHVDEAFANIDRAAAQAELTVLALDEATEDEVERPYMFGDVQTDLAFPQVFVDEARGMVIA
jgi:hypothetical protein